VDSDRFVREFRIGNSRYKVVIRASGEVLFYLATPRIDSWGYDIPQTSLENSSDGKSVAIFAKVEELVDSMVFQHRPPVLWLRIETERRRPLYGRLVDRFLQRHLEYRSCDDDWEDRLYLVRI
jgi:hypothetical protein